MSADFASLRLPREVVQAYPPNGNRLLAVLCRHTTDEMLRAVAGCDYADRASENFEALRRLQRGLDWEKPRKWVPREVLNLFKWSELQDEKVLMDPNKFHVARVFVCAVLLRVPDEIENEGEYDNDALAPLIESALYLGSEVVTPLVGHMVWMLEKMDVEEEDFLFHAFGLLVVLRMNDQSPPPEILKLVGRWTLHTSKELLPTCASWFLTRNRTFMNLKLASVSHKKWRSFAYLLKRKGSFEPEIDAFVEEVARG